MNLHSQVLDRRRALALTATCGLLAAAAAAGLPPNGAQASSHREAPLIAGLPEYDTTDLYAFRSPDDPGSVALIANWIPFEEPAGGPNFYKFAEDAQYNIKIDNNGDAKADITYRWKFKDHYRSGNTFLYNTGPVTSLQDKNLNFFQTYRLTKIEHGHRTVLGRHIPVAPSDVGDASMPNYAGLRHMASKRIGGTRAFAGQAEDPFFADLRVFDLLYGANLSEVGDDTLKGFNVNSVALEVPRKALVQGSHVRKHPVIGVWTTTDRRSANGKFRQISRLGMPLVNEVVVPVKDKNKYNASKPVNDVANFASYILHPELPAVVQAVYGIKAPATPRNDLLALVTGIPGVNQPKHVTPSDELRLNVTTPVTPMASQNRLGLLGGDTDGFPNGRRLGDDVLDISVRVLEGALLPADKQNPLATQFTDGVDMNDRAFSGSFPFLALPFSGSDASPH